MFLPVKELRQRSFFLGSPPGPAFSLPPEAGPAGLVPANFFGGPSPVLSVRGRNSRGRSSRAAPSRAAKGFGLLVGGPYVRGRNGLPPGRSVPRDGRPSKLRGAPRSGPRSGPRAESRPPARSGPGRKPVLRGRSLGGPPGRGRNGRSPEAGRSVLGLKGRAPVEEPGAPVARPGAGRNGFDPPANGRDGRLGSGLSSTGSIRKPGVLLGTKSSSSAGRDGRTKSLRGPAGRNGLAGRSFRNSGLEPGLDSGREPGLLWGRPSDRKAGLARKPALKSGLNSASGSGGPAFLGGRT